MGRKGIASFALLLGAVLEPIVLLAAVGPCGAGVGWRAYDAGGVAFSAPEAMRSPDIERQSQAPFDPAEPDWGFTLTDTPAAPDRGLTVSFGWSSGESTASPTTRDIGRAAFTLNDRQATRIDWLDSAMNWRGLDVVVAGISSNGKVFRASCHAPAAKWAKAGPVCEAIVATLQWPASAPVETDAAEPPSSQPESAATDEPLIAEPPPSPVAASAPQTETPPSAAPSETPPSGLLDRATLLEVEIAAATALVLAVVGILAVRLGRRPRSASPLPESKPPPPQPGPPPIPKCFCPYCGGRAAAGARFCSACGKPMPEQE